jgi:hypothetical protein
MLPWVKRLAGTFHLNHATNLQSPDSWLHYLPSKSPSCHGCSYAANGKYVVTVETTGDLIHKYSVDETGIPVKDQPLDSPYKTTKIRPAGWFLKFLIAVLPMRKKNETSSGGCPSQWKLSGRSK